MAWYVVEAFEGKDENAYLRLVSGGFKAWRPVDGTRSTRRFSGKKLVRAERRRDKLPRFGRFIFINEEMNDFIHNAILQTRNVRRFLCMAGGTEPARVPDELIDFYKHNVPVKPKFDHGFKVGETVRVLAAPFVGFHSVVTEVVDNRDLLKIELSIFGRPTPLIIEVGHVERVELGPRPPIKPNVKAHGSQMRA